MIFVHEEIVAEDLGAGVCRKVLAHGGKMLCAEVHFEKDAVGAPHSHPHEQIGYVAKGSFLYTEGDAPPRTLHAGDTYYVAPDVVHGVVALEESVVVDVFTPQRQDFLK